VGLAAGPAGAAPTQLFSSSTPGFVASAATVPTGICFVTVTADGGHGGDSPSATGGAGATVTARVSVSVGGTLSVMVGGTGGSSFAVTGATGVSSGPSTRTGNGQVIITYDPATDGCPTPAPEPAAAAAIETPIAFTG
jgi:hypothetical protein